MKTKYEYNPELINASILARKRLAKTCRNVAKTFSPVPLPETVIKRIYTRRKLYNFLESLELSEEKIRYIFKSNGIAFPKDRALKISIRKEEPRPEWLDRINYVEPTHEFNF